MTILFRQFFVVAGLTVREVVRQPVTMLVTTLGILLVGLLPLFSLYTLGESERMVRDSGLAVFLVSGLLLGAYAAGTTLAHELRGGTASGILSKPVNRALFFLGKAFGVGAVLVLFGAAMSMAVIMSARMAHPSFHFDGWAGVPLLAVPAAGCLLGGVLNYATRRSFPAAAFSGTVAAAAAAYVFVGFLDTQGGWTAFGGAYDLRLWPVTTLVGAAVLLLSAIALAISVRLDTLPTLFAVTLIFLLGLSSYYLFGRHADTHLIAGVLYAVIPDWQHFWVVDGLAGGGRVPWSYTCSVLSYAAACLVAVLALGIAAIRGVEVE
ncbi:hypothetical protein [Kiritimatiella glycovorans]|uniref:ABC-type transport system involved in multi-copper enzyme maturation, permease component n=1 Tax=Kiritimatiella glycovorans TaxID=1307763 RepID=A0A0G3EGR7_9BACT|nr:hypothetical protein [Kiritimatiella glycovorans]AKJ65548.1 hypothetical protein L21SP4_02322 [Kiritimatiella glycovorans]